jgi:dTDP-4-dehydrorhamnose reductase
LTLFRQYRPELVLHAAAYTNVDGAERDPAAAFRVNADGTRNVASAAEDVGASLVAVSTDFVFDGAKREPYLETDATNPLNRYGASKLVGEEMAIHYCSRSYVVRTSWLYGLHGKNFPYAIINRARAGGALEVVADQTGTPTFTVDLVRAIDEIVQSPEYGIYHASNSGETTWHAFARAIMDRIGLPEVRVSAVTSAQYAAKSGSSTIRPAYSVLENRALEQRRLSPMRSWQQALDDFIAAAKAEGRI